MQDILRGFRRVLDFSGRDGRDAFWAYALVIFVLAMAGAMVVFLPAMGESMAKMQQYAMAHPDQAQITSGPGSYSISISGSHPDFLPDFAPTMYRMGAAMGVGVLFLAAAVTRRLHDRGRTGLWGMLPLPFLVFGIVQMPKVFAAIGDGETAPPGFFTAFANNMLYLAALGLLGFLLWGPSQPGANRFGEMPPQPPPRPPAAAAKRLDRGDRRPPIRHAACRIPHPGASSLAGGGRLARRGLDARARGRWMGRLPPRSFATMNRAADLARTAAKATATIRMASR